MIKTTYQRLQDFFERLRNQLGENVIRRKWLIFLSLFGAWLALLAGAFFSPQRQLYTSEQLMTKRSFENGSGQVEVVSQSYSPKTHIIVLEVETTDETSQLDRGINSNQLVWKLYSPNPSEKTTMEVVPLTDKKLSVIIRDVPDNFGVFAVEVTNKTVSTQGIDVEITSSSDETSHVKKENPEDSSMQFFITPQNDKLKLKNIRNVSREEFALNEITSEKEFQEGQIKKLNDSIKKLKTSIETDISTKQSLEEEGKYLTGDDLTNNQKSIETLENNITTKNEDIQTATTNIDKVNEKIQALDRKEEAIKDGSFAFANPIETVKMK